MILAGFLWGAACGNLDEVTQGLIASSGEAVSLGLSVLGIMAFWCGILEIGERAGLIGWLTEKLGPALDFLFPELPRSHPARKPLAVNLIANMLGLGTAAAPAGIEAMQRLRETAQGECEQQKRPADGSSSGFCAAAKRAGTATNSMCTFLILNISSLQLVPVTLLAYRSRYGSADPAAVLGPALIATACSTGAAVLFCKIADALTFRHGLPAEKGILSGKAEIRR